MKDKIKKWVIILTVGLMIIGILSALISFAIIMMASPKERLANRDMYDTVWHSFFLGGITAVVAKILLVVETIGFAVSGPKTKRTTHSTSCSFIDIGKGSAFDRSSHGNAHTDFNSDSFQKYNNQFYQQMQEQQRQMQEQMQQMQDEQFRQFSQWSMEETMKASTPIDQGGYSPNDSFNSLDSFGGFDNFGGFGNF